MEQRPITSAPGRAFSGVFHDYVRGVFAEHSARRRSLRARRARWLRGLAQRPESGAEQRWEGEGGSTR
ncbi:MAG TPA: hypothetical protein VFT23_02955 [Burkholderiales bacterium]|nr:hypothetical protein [Burkholderiales bacterium]